MLSPVNTYIAPSGLPEWFKNLRPVYGEMVSRGGKGAAGAATTGGGGDLEDGADQPLGLRRDHPLLEQAIDPVGPEVGDAREHRATGGHGQRFRLVAQFEPEGVEYPLERDHGQLP